MIGGFVLEVCMDPDPDPDPRIFQDPDPDPSLPGSVGSVADPKIPESPSKCTKKGSKTKIF